MSATAVVRAHTPPTQSGNMMKYSAGKCSARLTLDRADEVRVQIMSRNSPAGTAFVLDSVRIPFISSFLGRQGNTNQKESTNLLNSRSMPQTQRSKA